MNTGDSSLGAGVGEGIMTARSAKERQSRKRRCLVHGGLGLEQEWMKASGQTAQTNGPPR